MEKTQKNKKSALLVLLLVVLMAAMGWLYLNSEDYRSPDAGQVITLAENREREPDPVPEMPDDGLPHDKLFITVERQLYEDDALRLRIPKLSINRTLKNGTTTAQLQRGPCLYEYAQLPGEGNRNVSIAAHRNGRVNGKVTVGTFYYIDTLGEGDYLYLVDSEQIYKYRYLDTKVVEADDWGPILSQGFSCLTLTSCEPIGISTHRIIVRAQLQEIVPNETDYPFVSREESAHALGSQH